MPFFCLFPKLWVEWTAPHASSGSMCHYVLQETANKINRNLIPPQKKKHLMKNFSENKASWRPRENFSAGFNQVYRVSTQLMHSGLPLILLRTSALGFGSVNIINTKGRFCNTFCEEVDKKNQSRKPHRQGTIWNQGWQWCSPTESLCLLFRQTQAGLFMGPSAMVW